MKFEFDNSIPIYIQLVEQLKIYIISGSIHPGSRLPSVRELALETKVNPNTMQKALAELEDLKLIYTERTNGKYVTENQELIKELKLEYATNLSKEYLAKMKEIGFTESDVIEHLKKQGGMK